MNDNSQSNVGSAEVEKEKLFDIIKNLNVGYKNPDEPMVLKSAVEIGALKFHAVAFKGADNRWHENYVIEDEEGELKGYQNIQQALPEVIKKTNWLSILHSNFQTITFFAVTIMLVLTVCVLALLGEVGSDNVIALTTLAFGYMAGKSGSNDK